MVQKTSCWLETWGVNVNSDGHLHLVSICTHLFRGHLCEDTVAAGEQTQHGAGQKQSQDLWLLVQQTNIHSNQCLICWFVAPFHVD